MLMNEIRKNDEEEKVLLEGTFKLSLGAILCWLAGIAILGVPLAMIIIAAPTMRGEINGEPAQGWQIAMPLVIFFAVALLILMVYETLKLIAIKKSKLVVTNKRIHGTYSVLIARKNFSYRLDEIDNVEMYSSLGRHILCLQFTQGHGPTFQATTYVNGVPTSGGYNVLKMANLKNYVEVYDTLNGLVCSRKNLVDLQTDIEMEKIKAENRKADALENAARNLGAGVVAGNAAKSSSGETDYIQELKELKKLLDDGIITQQEFEQEKKEILDNNHRS